MCHSHILAILNEISDHLLIAENRYIDRSVVKIFEIWKGSTD
jgi:hypothetical protein